MPILLSNVLVSWPGKFVAGHDGSNGSSAIKSFSFPGMEAVYGYNNQWYTFSRKVELSIDDDLNNPNLFGASLVFEVERISATDIPPQDCQAIITLYEIDPLANPNQQAVANFEGTFVRSIGIHLAQIRLSNMQAVRYGAAKRSMYATFQMRVPAP